MFTKSTVLLALARDERDKSIAREKNFIVREGTVYALVNGAQNKLTFYISGFQLNTVIYRG